MEVLLPNDTWGCITSTDGNGGNIQLKFKTLDSERRPRHGTYICSTKLLGVKLPAVQIRSTSVQNRPFWEHLGSSSRGCRTDVG